MNCEKKMSRGTRLLAVMLCILLLVSGLGLGRSSPEDRYKDAIELLQEGKYAEAAPKFRELGYYQEAGKYAMYAAALTEAEKGNYLLAVSAMTTLGDFMDSSLLAVYFSGRYHESIQEYEEAGEIYASILLFKDVQERVAKLPEMILQRDYSDI